MRQFEPFYNLYQTSILICCMPSEQQVVSVHLKSPGVAHSQRLSMVKYTTGTATEFDSSGV